MLNVLQVLYIIVLKKTVNGFNRLYTLKNASSLSTMLLSDIKYCTISLCSSLKTTYVTYVLSRYTAKADSG